MQINYTSKDAERFWSKVDKSGGEDACWIWTSAFSYTCGVITWMGKTRSAIQIAYELTFGEIPHGFDLLHLCKNNSCCNPSHLSLGVNHNMTETERFWSKIEKSNDNSCWLWMASTDSLGYGGMNWKGKRQKAHRIMWILTYGEIPNNLEVCHSCDNPPCVNPKHLWLGTHQDNMDDMNKKGRRTAARGERSGNHKLTQLQVDEIRKRYRRNANRNKIGEGAEILAKEFGVSSRQILQIVNHKFWK
jgi:hypothetical protein